MDLILGAFEHDSGINGAFAVFKLEGEGKVGELFSCPEERAGFLGIGLAVDGAILDGPMSGLAFGIDAPLVEVLSVKERLFG